MREWVVAYQVTQFIAVSICPAPCHQTDIHRAPATVQCTGAPANQHHHGHSRRLLGFSGCETRLRPSGIPLAVLQAAALGRRSGRPTTIHSYRRGHSGSPLATYADQFARRRTQTSGARIRVGICARRREPVRSAEVPGSRYRGLAFSCVAVNHLMSRRFWFVWASG
jgi:hypothetical protein